VSDDALAEIIEKGKEKTPGYGKSMKPDEIKDMVAYFADWQSEPTERPRGERTARFLSQSDL
jgi:hypothetical protein